MKRIMMVVVVVVVGCFGKPATVTPVETERKDVEKTPSPQVAASPVQGAKTNPAPLASSASIPQPAVVAANGSDVQMSVIRVGDPALETSVRFTADRAGAVRVTSGITNGLRLYRVITDQFGQAELVGEIKDADMALPVAGTYVVAGKEKLPSFTDVPLGGTTPVAASYRVQSVSGCQPPEEIQHGYNVGAWQGKTTRTIKDPQFPRDKRVVVWLHRGAGNSNDPRDSFGPWVEYLKDRYPRRNELAPLVKDYIPDYWDSVPAPNVAAAVFRSRQTDCNGAGYRSVSVCHSAGCLKALLAGLDLGLVAVAPAFGGSHLATEKLTDAALSQMYGMYAARFGAVRTLILWEWGLLLRETRATRILKDFLAGTQFTLYNEGARALTWHGRGTGIPTVNYRWFSWSFFGDPYLELRLKPEVKYAMPMDAGGLGGYAPATYDGKYNFAEAAEAWSLGPVATGNVDVAVCYLNGGHAEHIRVFEEKYIATDSVKLDQLWRLVTNEEERRTFKKSALPWASSLIAKSPSVTPHDPGPNENAVNDGTLTACQQLACKDAGPSTLAQGSTYGAIKINRSAGDSRKAHFVGTWKEFPGRDHYDAVEGSFDDDGLNDGDQLLWDWMAERLLARVVPQVEARRKEEEELVLTDGDKSAMRFILSPGGGTEFASGWAQGDTPFSDTVPYKETYHFLGWERNMTYQQDPLGTGQKNRVRMAGSGETLRTSEQKIGDTWVYAGSSKGPWQVGQEFVRLDGSWRLVVN